MEALISQANKVLVFVPTYNERDNVEWLFDGIKSLGLGVDILFVDDNSPDGTGKILDSIANKNPEVTILHRAEKSGIGAAHQCGIQWAYQHGYSTLVTMDADLTHSPHDIPRLLEHSPQFPIVLGSRYLQQNSLEGWTFFRKFLTRVGNILTTHMLGIKQDATGAFRAYRLDIVPPELFEAVSSKSYSFFFESLQLLHSNSFEIKEVAIALPPRTYGSSKMRVQDIVGSLKLLFSIFLRSKFTNKKFYPRTVKTGKQP